MGIVKRINSMEIQGAINIAIEALKHLKEFAKTRGFGPAFDKECKKLLKTRPTGVALFNVISEIKKEKSMKKLNELLKKIKDDYDKIAKNGEKIFRKRSVVMTHCHSSEVLYLLKKNKSRIKEVIVTETRPRYQGLITAKELTGLMSITFIVDSAVMSFTKETDMIIVGADSISKKGVANKIGTHLMAVAAKEERKPFYVAASRLKYDKRKEIIIEERSSDEVCKLKNIKIRNPAFDITPWKYVTAVITEDGIKKPKQIIKELM
jgi:ribose 1,5-bisphosphate isomerase